MSGEGAGAEKVMRIPFKVSTATSNFMIGVTAAASATIYLKPGYIDPILAMPVMLGVVAGSFLGARKLAGARTHLLKLLSTRRVLNAVGTLSSTLYRTSAISSIVR